MKKLREVFSDNGTIEYFPFYLSENADQYFDQLAKNLKWNSPEISIFGKQIQIPRMQAFYGDIGISYKYSRTTFEAIPWDSTLKEIRDKISKETGAKYNCVLCNYYRNGMDYMALHSDDEPELQKNPTIASLSLGNSRIFQVRSKIDKEKKIEFILNNGDLLVMRDEFQEYWQHGIKKTRKKCGPRLNLTFRYIY